MDSPWPQNLPSNGRRAIEELLQGQEFAKELRNLLISSEHGLVSAEDLAVKILASFTDSLSLLTCGESEEISELPAKSSPYSDGRKSEDSGETCKSSTFKDRRGCYKRRRGSNSWTRVTPTLIDDGYAWRKYGQKIILHANHPRSYFRCTHKHDQDCKATKQVQKTDDDPPMYRITYNGHHTCRNFLNAPPIILDYTCVESSKMLNFESNDPAGSTDDNRHPFSSSFTSVKQEHLASDYVTQNESPSSDYLLSPEFTSFDACGPMTNNLGSDYGGDVISCTASTHGKWEMDIVVGSVAFDDLQFEF